MSLHFAASIFNLPTGLATGDVPGLFNGILDIFIALAYPFAFVAILYTSYILISSSGKPEAYNTAKKNLLMVFTGIFLIVFAVVFVRFITRLFSF